MRYTNEEVYMFTCTNSFELFCTFISIRTAFGHVSAIRNTPTLSVTLLISNRPLLMNSGYSQHGTYLCAGVVA